jgi:hypothetical protein
VTVEASAERGQIAKRLIFKYLNQRDTSCLAASMTTYLVFSNCAIF